MFLAIFSFYASYYIYTKCMKGIMQIVELRSIIYFNWRVVPLSLIFPSVIYFAVLCLSVLLSREYVPYRFIYRWINVALGYMGVSLVVGFILSVAIGFYPLDTDYVVCQGGGPLSGVYYTKTKEICEQLKVVRENEPHEAIQQLNDRLDSIPPQ